MAAVLKSRDAKTLADATTALKSKTDQASALLKDSDGRVQDNATRDALGKAIDQARTLLDAGVDAKAMNDASAALDRATAAVNDSMKAKSDADARAAAEAAAAQAAQQAPVVHAFLHAVVFGRRIRRRRVVVVGWFGLAGRGFVPVGRRVAVVVGAAGGRRAAGFGPEPVSGVNGKDDVMESTMSPAPVRPAPTRPVASAPAARPVTRLLPVFDAPATDRVWLVAAHGGAGCSTIYRSAPALYADAGRALPYVADPMRPPRVVLCATGSCQGLDALRALLAEWDAGMLAPCVLLGVAVTACMARPPRLLRRGCLQVGVRGAAPVASAVPGVGPGGGLAGPVAGRVRADGGRVGGDARLTCPGVLRAARRRGRDLA